MRGALRVPGGGMRSLMMSCSVSQCREESGLQKVRAVTTGGGSGGSGNMKQRAERQVCGRRWLGGVVWISIR